MPLYSHARGFWGQQLLIMFNMCLGRAEHLGSSRLLASILHCSRIKNIEYFVYTAPDIVATFRTNDTNNTLLV